jgi:hypothetical protein
MDAEQIRRLQPMLSRYLKLFDDCFSRKDTRKHFSVYVEGQLSDLDRKSVALFVHVVAAIRDLTTFYRRHFHSRPFPFPVAMMQVHSHPANIAGHPL